MKTLYVFTLMLRLDIYCLLILLIPWTEEPGRLQSMGSLRVRHDWATSLSLFTFMHWRRKWQPTLVFLPGESQGQMSVVGCTSARCMWVAQSWTRLKWLSSSKQSLGPYSPTPLLYRNVRPLSRIQGYGCSLPLTIWLNGFSPFCRRLEDG